MTTYITSSANVDPGELHHHTLSEGEGVLVLGEWPGFPRVDLLFKRAADVDAVIAELVALRAEMTGEGAPVYDPATDNCSAECGDQRAIFQYHGPQAACPRCYRNIFAADPAPSSVVTIPAPAGRCAAASTPEPVDRVPWPTGLCGHTVTPGAWSQGFALCRECLSVEQRPLYDRATAGEQLDQAAQLPAVADPCECSHQKPEHAHYDGASRECRHPGCGCGEYRPRTAVTAPEPPRVVAGTVATELPASVTA